MLTAEFMTRFRFESFVWIVWHLRIDSKCRLKSRVHVIFVPGEKISDTARFYKTNKKMAIATKKYQFYACSAVVCQNTGRYRQTGESADVLLNRAAGSGLIERGRE